MLAVLIAGCQPPVRVILVYKVDTDFDPDAVSVDVETVAQVVRARVYPNRVRVLDDGRIEVGLSDDDPADVARMDRVIRALGTLEFRVVANRCDHRELIELATHQAGASRIRDENGELLGWWVPLATSKASVFQHSPEIVLRATGPEDGKTAEVLVANDLWRVNGSYITAATPGVDGNGRPCLNFQFNHRGGQLMAGLTGDNTPDQATGFRRRLGIILDGTLHSAPNIASTIRERGLIEGNSTPEEAEDLAAVLNGGSLPVIIKKVSQRKVASED